MPIFITGICSFVGKELVRQCRARGIECSGIDLVENSLQGDIRDPGIGDLIPENTDAIVHLAAMSRDGDCKNKAYECFDSNVMGTLNLIRAAEKRKAKQFIFASTEWVYDAFKEGEVKDEGALIDMSKIQSEYALSKLVSEVNLQQKFAHGFCPVTILRFGIIYGPREKNWSAVESLFNAVKTKEEVQVGSLRTGRCFIHVEDIVQGIIASLGLPGFNIINLQGSKLITLEEIIYASGKVLEKAPKVVETAPDRFNVRNVSNTKAFQLMGWKPQVDLYKGLNSLK